jgi:integrin beta 3
MGPQGFANVHVVSVSREAQPKSPFISAKAVCGAGEVVLSGGFSVSSGGQTFATITENMPFDAAEEQQRAGWKSTAVLERAALKGTSVTLTAFAICAEAPER